MAALIVYVRYVNPLGALAGGLVCSVRRLIVQSEASTRLWDEILDH
jgi:hypothetical protein